ncbi:MAG: SHOCT domain-containing protein [Alphaproteobacteria bacterium]|nr:SHOCT domain-containing protein [Alphaproteobacteria bacterium]MBL6938585.1 SHOCT domain-containing protein [Alphaproteobacteria bacterium]MBL7098058.1 SHOCT domain-containing protein [Alphaproteobacteria bacterium]
MLHALFFWPLFFWSPFHGLGGLILVIVVLALVFGPRRYYWRYPYYGHPWNPPGSRAEALSILEQRYARGEIQRDEYLQKKQDLGG